MRRRISNSAYATGARGQGHNKSLCPCVGTACAGIQSSGHLLAALLLALLLLTFAAPAYAACANPSGAAGDMVYNKDFRTVQYCDGGIWVSTAPAQYAPQGAHFDGSTTYLTRGGDLTGNGDSKVVGGGFWFRRTGGTGATRVIYSNTSDRFQISFNTANRLRFLGRNTSGTTILDLNANTQITDTNWHHVIFSFDMANAANRYVYIDDAQETLNVTTYTDANIDFTRTNHAVGATTTGANKYNGDLAELSLDIGTYTDVSIEAIRRYFITADLKPVESSSICSGASICLYGDIASWHTNKGVGGGLTKNGTLGDAGDIAGSWGYNVTNGLVGHWAMDDGSGTTAVDFSGNGNDGTFVNSPTWTTGKLDGALSFVAANTDYVSVPDNTSLRPTTWTLSAWVKLNSLPGAGNVYPIFMKQGHAAGYGAYGFSVDDLFCSQSFGGGFQDSVGGQAGTCAGFTVSTGVWYHVATTWDGTDLHLYVDGVLVDSNLGSGLTPANNAGYPVSIGKFLGTYYMDGVIDDARIYDRPLSDTEISQLYLHTYPCANPNGATADILYNTTSHVPQFCDGAEWVSMGPVPGAGGGGCSSPAGSEGEMFYNDSESRMQYCDGTNWIMIGAPPSGPTGCPNPGDLCSDGSVYAGTTPATGGKMYVTDVNQSTSTQWKATTGNDDMDPNSSTDGQANHANVTVAMNTLPAMDLCETLDRHGHQDWYLPARQELDVLYTNMTAINANATESLNTSYYWSSTEDDNVNGAWSQRFDTGGQFLTNKTFNADVRCVRRN